MSRRDKIRQQLKNQTEQNLKSAGRPAETKVYRRGAEVTITIPYLNTLKSKSVA